MNGEEFTQLLEHAHYYDPVKAHDYYMRTRRLKGRQHGSDQPGSSPRNGSNGSQNGKNNLPAKANPTARELRQQADERTKALKVRIKRLEFVLERLVAEAKKRSGVETPPKHDAHKTSPAQKPEHHRQTQKEKQAQKRYDERHRKPAPHKPAPESTDKQLQNKIEQLQEKIQAIRRQLKQAVKDARDHAGAGDGSGRPRTQPRSKQ